MSDESETRKVVYLDARFDVTDLTEQERGNLAGEVQAQAERSKGDADEGGHPGVEVEVEWNEVDPHEAFVNDFDRSLRKHTGRGLDSPPWDAAGTVYDHDSETFAPILRAIERGDFEEAAAALLAIDTTPAHQLVQEGEVPPRCSHERIRFGHLERCVLAFGHAGDDNGDGHQYEVEDSLVLGSRRVEVYVKSIHNTQPMVFELASTERVVNVTRGAGWNYVTVERSL